MTKYTIYRNISQYIIYCYLTGEQLCSFSLGLLGIIVPKAKLLNCFSNGLGQLTIFKASRKNEDFNNNVKPEK